LSQSYPPLQEWQEWNLQKYFCRYKKMVYLCRVLLNKEIDIMEALLLEIEESKTQFLLELLRQFSFVKDQSVSNVEASLLKTKVNTVNGVKIK
jgi:hypothetical protein